MHHARHRAGPEESAEHQHDGYHVLHEPLLPIRGKLTSPISYHAYPPLARHALPRQHDGYHVLHESFLPIRGTPAPPPYVSRLPPSLSLTQHIHPQPSPLPITFFPTPYLTHLLFPTPPHPLPITPIRTPPPPLYAHPHPAHTIAPCLSIVLLTHPHPAFISISILKWEGFLYIYFFSLVFRWTFYPIISKIIDGVRDELNRLYEKFCARNPSFVENSGKVSIVSHSLGSVIAYDILSLWDIEERHLSADATASTGFLTESFTFLRSLSHTDSAAEPWAAESKGKKPKENLRVELAKARERVMELEAQLKTEVQHGKDAVDGANGQQFALRFKVRATCACAHVLFAVTSRFSVTC